MPKKNSVNREVEKILDLALDDTATERDLAVIVAEADPRDQDAALRKLVEEVSVIEEVRERTEKAKSRLEKAMRYPPQSFLIGGEQLDDLLMACPEDHIIGKCAECGYRGRITNPLCDRCGEAASFLIVSPTDNVRQFVYGV